MKAVLKYGGLLMSSLLTVSLFLDLFGYEAYGIMLSIGGLCLFEVGALGWAALLARAKGGQRSLVKFSTWYCVAASVASSAAQIILSTALWVAPPETGFVTLLVLASALAVNVCAVFGYEMLDPDRAETNRELDRQARAKEAAARLEERVIEQSLIKAEAKVAEIAGNVSDAMASEMRGDVVNYLLAQTRGGDNRRLPAPASNLPAPASTRRDPAAMDEIGRFFDDLIPERADDAPESRKNGHSPKA